MRDTVNFIYAWVGNKFRAGVLLGLFPGI